MSGSSAGAAVLKILGGCIVVLLVYISLSFERGPTFAPVGSVPSAPGGTDWNAVGARAAKDLQSLLRIRTVRGNEREAAHFLKDKLREHGIDSTIIEVPGKPDRVSLMAELPGKNADGGIILGSHLDVVEADASEWKVPPFDGKREGNRIYGRGAIDMKGMTIMQLHAFLLMKEMKVPMSRKVMFLGIADEESGSKLGAEYLISKRAELFKSYKTMLNEGGLGTRGVAVPGSLIFNLNYAEKGLLWLKVKAKGTSGHGHSPHVRYASLDLLEFLEALRNMESGSTITEETAMFFHQLGEASSFPNSFILKRSRNLIIKQILGRFINTNRFLRSMTSNTRSVTGLRAEDAGINVISNQATANVDIRLLPGVDPDEYLARVNQVAKKYNVEVEVVGVNAPSASPVASDFFKVMGRVAMQNVPGSVVAPFLSPGGTDCAYFRKINVDCYGFIPVLLESEELDGLHGKNESITEDNLRLGTKIIFEALIGMNR